MNILKTSQILNVAVNSLSFKETLSLINSCIQENKTINQVSINAGKLVTMQHDKTLYEAVNRGDLINADGQSIIWASKLFNNPIPERVTGTDLMQALIKKASKERWRMFFLGAREEVVKKVVKICSEKYGNHIVAGYRNGYFKDSEESSIVDSIAKSKADILFVGITSPRKERFIDKYKNMLNVSFSMGVGGSFDIIAGQTKRAPLWMQKIGLEWCYRLIQEPRRMWKRYLIGNVKFIFLILKQKLGCYKNPFS